MQRFQGAGRVGIDRQHGLAQIVDLDFRVHDFAAPVDGSIALRVQARVVEDDVHVNDLGSRPVRQELESGVAHVRLEQEASFAAVERELVERAVETGRAGRNATRHQGALEPVIELAVHELAGNEAFRRTDIGNAPAGHQVDDGRLSRVEGNLYVALAVEIGVADRDVVREHGDAVAAAAPDDRAGRTVDRHRFGHVLCEVDHHVPGADFEPPARPVGAQPPGEAPKAGAVAVRRDAGVFEIRRDRVTWGVRVYVRDRRDEVANDAVRRKPGEQVPPRVRQQRREQAQVGEVNVVPAGV